MFLTYWYQHNVRLGLTISKWLYQLNQTPSMQRSCPLLSNTLDIRLLIKILCLWAQYLSTSNPGIAIFSLLDKLIKHPPRAVPSQPRPQLCYKASISSF